MCTGRIDLAFVLRAFSKGADGVLIAGCHLNECNYLTQGNFYALSMVQLCKKLMEQVGVQPDRLRVELVSGGEGTRFAEIVNDFSEAVHQLGPIRVDTGLVSGERTVSLVELLDLVPYIKVQLREKLQTRLQTEEEYGDLFTAAEVAELLGSVASYYIDPDKCRACMLCAKRCPVEAIEGGKNRIHVVDQVKCIRCGMCLDTCPPLFGAVRKISREPVPPPLAEEQRTIHRKKKPK